MIPASHYTTTDDVERELYDARQDVEFHKDEARYWRARAKTLEEVLISEGYAFPELSSFS